MLARIALLKDKKRISSSLKKSMASSFQREFLPRSASNFRRRSAAASESGHSGSYQFSAASQPLDNRATLRSRSRFTRSNFRTSSPGNTMTNSAQKGGNGIHVLNCFSTSQE